MKASTLLLAISVIGLMPASLPGQQQPSAPLHYQVTNMIKVVPGKGSDYVQFINDTSRKVAQTRVDSGEIISWTLLRSVMPAGQEARSDYMISTISEGPPRAPQSREDVAKSLQQAGVAMTAADFLAKRDSMSSLVATEMWRPRIRIGAAQKGHYLYLNYMKVLDATAYYNFEDAIWRPMAEAWVKEGSQSGWMFGTKMLPTGTDTVYGAYSADIYPSWEAVFKTRPTQPTFEKIHSGKNYNDTMNQLSTLRNLARRELWVVVERVAKK